MEGDMFSGYLKSELEAGSREREARGKKREAGEWESRGGRIH